ncbi:MAG TPA: DCC1-like thiol-disulfide oxidoreductase family protein [Bacteroidia bacterium]|nr:DCC1-like thiol-disulfide oxidoreductase family protein [Bacteroidia bacterium]
MALLTENKDVVLFDGVCGLCNRSVKFLIRKERKPELLFSPLQSVYGKSLLEKYGINAGSIVYIHNNKAYTKSGAALRLCLRLKGLWPLMIVFMIVPYFIRDFVYDYIAKNRITWFGSTEYCEVMTSETRGRFVE